MTRQKTIETKTPSKIGSLAAAVAMVLPLYTGCVKKDTVAPASQQSGYTEVKRAAPKRMAATMILYVGNDRWCPNRKVECPEGSLCNPAKVFSFFGATAGSKFATSNYCVTVVHVDNDGISLLAEGPGHNIGFRVPYGRMCNDWPEVGVVRAEKGKRPNAANVTIRPSGSAIRKMDDSVTSVVASPGDTFERNGYQVNVISLTESGVVIHAVSKKHLLFQVPYGKDFADAPEIGTLRAERGCRDNTVKLEIR